MDTTVIPEAWGLPPTVTVVAMAKRLAKHLTAAAEAKQRDIPIHVVGLGSAQPTKDIRLSDLLVDDVVFVGDLVTFDLRGDAVLALDASAAGIDQALDLDGVHSDPELNLIDVTFDGSGEVGGIRFDDEDVMTWDPIRETWSMLFDASANDSDWLALDADALFATFTQAPAILLSDGFETGDLSGWSEVSE